MLSGNQLKLDKPVSVAGFYLPTKARKQTNSESAASVGESSAAESQKLNDMQDDDHQHESANISQDGNEFDSTCPETSEASSTILDSPVSPVNEEHIQTEAESVAKENKEDHEDQKDRDESESNDGEDNEEDEDDDEEDDQEGWITPGNLEEIKKLTLNEFEQQEAVELKIKVGCMTSDFSMQVQLKTLFI